MVESSCNHPLLSGQARVFTLTPQDAQTSNAMVAGILLVCSFEARVLFDSGASYSFISSFFFEDGVATIQIIVFLVCSDST